MSYNVLRQRHYNAHLSSQNFCQSIKKSFEFQIPNKQVSNRFFFWIGALWLTIIWNLSKCFFIPLVRCHRSVLSMTIHDPNGPQVALVVYHDTTKLSSMSSLNPSIKLLAQLAKYCWEWTLNLWHHLDTLIL